jgi:hypothetical protein
VVEQVDLQQVETLVLQLVGVLEVMHLVDLLLDKSLLYYMELEVWVEIISQILDLLEV